MEVFYLSLRQMLIMFLLIAVGFALRKKHLVPDNAANILSKLEIYVFVPALMLHTQMNRCTAETFSSHAGLILIGLAAVLSAIVLSVPLARLFVPRRLKTPEEDYQRKIYQYAMIFSNFGFMGNFIVLGIWGEEMFFLYSLFTIFFHFFCNVLGLLFLIPKDRSASLAANLKKGLLTPIFIAIMTGMFLGLTGLAPHMPSVITSTLESASACQGPVAMLLTGMVIGGFNLRELVTNRRVYAASFVRLIVLPIAAVMTLRLLGAAENVCLLGLVAFACPLGLNTIVYPAAYDCDTKTGASMVMISHTLCIITIPLMYLLLFEVL